MPSTTYQTGRVYGDGGDQEFEFWSKIDHEKEVTYESFPLLSYNHSYSNSPPQIEPITEGRRHCDRGDQEFEFWSEIDHENEVTYESFPLLPYNHSYSNSPPQIEPITGGRRHCDRGDQEFEFWSEIDHEKEVTYESFPLLPCNHSYGTPRLELIVEGRRKMMDMVRGMPESSYELSLKDLVVDDQPQVEVVADAAKVQVCQKSSDATTDEMRRQRRGRKLMKNKSNVNLISRSGSMGKEFFLIKMFIPSSLQWKSKANSASVSKVSPRPSFEGSENHVDNKQKLLKRQTIDRKPSSNSSSGSNSSRGDGNDSFHGCLPFFGKKGKNRKQRLCAF